MAHVNATSAPANESFVYSGTELDAMAEAHNYCRWIMRYFAPYLGSRVVEIGAGTGTFSELLLKQETTAELVLFEAASNLFPLLRQRFASRKVQLHCGSFACSLLSEPADSVVLVNVLEHIQDDGSLLSQIRDSLCPSGRILLFVPALTWNYGSLDRAFGHYRRYSKRGLRHTLEAAGFRVMLMHHVNVMGIASWFFAGKVFRQTTLRPAQVRWYDRWVVPWSFKLEQIFEPPLGQSLLAVATR
jgi:SAM-dependent methyltransferase